jgi:excisionase family DNA binding protein
MRFLTPELVAEQLAVSRSTVLRMIADGALPAVCLRSGRRKKIWRIREDQLNKWILGREKQAGKNVKPPSITEPIAAPNNGGDPSALDYKTSAHDKFP